MQKNLNLCKFHEENRLKAVYDSEQRLSSYLYDAGGERTLKMSGSYQSTYINSSLTISSVNMTDYTLYTSPYMVMTDNEYTKHYYVEADRVASKIGGGMANNITGINDVVIGFEMQSEENYLQKNNDVLDMMTNDFNELEVHASIEVYTNTVFWEDEALGQNGSEGDLIYFFHKDHLGSSTQISDISANIIHHVEYMPFGETFVEQRSNWGTNYKFNGKELDEETGFYYYGARYYNPDISIWLSIDPLSDKYPSLSPYNYCANNPIKYVDPDGREINPVFDLDGNLLGTDDKGLKGDPIFMKKDDFKQGMSHDEAKSKDLGAKSLNSAESVEKVYSTMCGLSNRPDYDGFVSREEGIAWAKQHPNALENPTSYNTLYIDASKLDFGGLGAFNFTFVGKIEPQNLLTIDNFADAMHNSKLRATVYALGRVNMVLLNRGDRTVQIVNDNATDYDWNTGGGLARNSLIKLERLRNKLNDTHGFKVFYYGVGKLNK